MRIEHASVGLTEIKLAPDSTTKGTFSGYGAVFGNVDAYGDVIQRGAFKKTLREWKAKGKLPPMLLQHGGGMFGSSPDGMLPIGKWEYMEETSKGLYVEGRLLELETDLSKRVLAGLKEGVLDGLSIGFRTRQAITGTKPGEPRRTLTDIDLVEVSIVTFPANPKARVSSVKMTAEELRELESTLRDAGLSRKDAVIAASAFKNWLLRDAGAPSNLLRDEGDTAEPTDLMEAAQQLLAKFTNGALRY